jgi:hypothetical protein
MAGKNRDLPNKETFGLQRVQPVKDRGDPGRKRCSRPEGEDIHRPDPGMQGRGSVFGATAGLGIGVRRQAEAGRTCPPGHGTARPGRAVQQGRPGKGSGKLQRKRPVVMPRHDGGQHIGCPHMRAVALQLEGQPNRIGGILHSRVT